MHENYTYGLKRKALFLMIAFAFSTFFLQAQSGFAFSQDTLNTDEHGFFSIPEIDYEIEKINNSLNKTSRELNNVNLLLDTDTAYLDLIYKTNKEFEDFNSYALKIYQSFSWRIVIEYVKDMKKG